MEPLKELKLHVDALATVVDANPKFFASVKHYVAQLQQLLCGPNPSSRTDLTVLASKIEEFCAQWRPSRSSEGVLESQIVELEAEETRAANAEDFEAAAQAAEKANQLREQLAKLEGEKYIPPRETADTDSTVQRLNALVRDLAGIDETVVLETVKHVGAFSRQSDREPQSVVTQPCIFIGHGRSRLWARLKIYLEDELDLATVTYESESRTGDSIVPVLEKMLDQTSFAVLLLTAEDDGAVGAKRARQNVIHEAGLFQGRLGFGRAVLLIQEGIEEFSNVAGLQHIPFPGDNVEQTFYELQRVLKREQQISLTG